MLLRKIRDLSRIVPDDRQLYGHLRPGDVKATIG
jgi:hypothetical protein